MNNSKTPKVAKSSTLVLEAARNQVVHVSSDLSPILISFYKILHISAEGPNLIQCSGWTVNQAECTIKQTFSLVIKAQCGYPGEVNYILGFATTFCLMLSWVR